ncbi:leukemia inhibitory factor receptor alpha b isoform X1 [Silurus asotus]|uniref:Leukemia inhibitory factor receptor alpha b isoform X1 n=1 Tax=Silurus asotus TaxID=30991 RepID=A0AAD5B0C7_SILAS|nr:leukemia inhibitory factor receptor alpha b isoform X1 [Silurus asotus]
MARVCVWFLGAVLLLLIVEKQDAHTLAAPKNLQVYAEGGLDNFGVWKMNIEWEDGFTNSIQPDTVTYDVYIFYTETGELVHNAMSTGYDMDTTLYPQNYIAMVNESIRFCCILKPDHNYQSGISVFTIKISSRSYATEPIRHPYPSPEHGFDIKCGDEGSVYYIGYAPDDHSLTCETRDLSSVECHWKQGKTKNLSKIFEQINYINGRTCNIPEFCVVDNTIDTGLVNWTLTAKNKLGTKIIFDTADPKHRVHLKAPTLKPVTVLNARNTTLEWIWNGLNLSSFSMVCQVEVNERIINESFEGTGLISVILEELQPFTQYKARVRCGSREHFYKWGDWSNLITFDTKEDIPAAVDVWMQVFNEQTYIVWKKLSAAQSHGTITAYKLVMESSTNGKTEHVTKSPIELCHKVPAGSSKTPHVYSVSAENSAGVSHPSNITIPNLSPVAGVFTRNITGNNGAFELMWELSPKSRCGYVLDWYPTYNAQLCSVQWMKIPSSVLSAKISSDFKEGVKYTLSVYACTSGAPYLLQRTEGYMVELLQKSVTSLPVSNRISGEDVASVSMRICDEAPSGKVQNLTATQEGLNIYLSWGNVQEHEQRGFIKGYNVSYSHAGGDQVYVVIPDPGIQKYKFSLPVETYIFTVKAFTSAGEGPRSETTVSMDPQVDLVIIKVAFFLAVMLVLLCIISLLFYRNRKWVKSVLWPEVPKPTVSDDFLKKNIYQGQVIDHLLHEESEVLKVKSPEICPAIIVLDQQKEHHEAQNLYSTQSKDSLSTDMYQTPNSNPQTLPLIIDFSYKEIPCPGIPNPTYNLPVTPAGDNDLILGYMPQTQNGSN